MGLRSSRVAGHGTKPNLTDLGEYLRYDPETGQFSWLKPRPGAKVGKPAGTRTIYGYNQVCFRGKSLRAAVLAWALMMGEWPDRTVDHINRDRTDDRWSNLRLATPSENNANRGRQRNNTSGYKGVVFIKREGRWRAMLQGRRGEKGQFLGLFDSAEAAHEAYCAAAEKRFGEFALSKLDGQAEQLAA